MKVGGIMSLLQILKLGPMLIEPSSPASPSNVNSYLLISDSKGQ